MPKSRVQKEEMLATLVDRLKRSQSVVFLAVQGVKVGQVESIRDELFKNNLQLQVAKNSLFKIALAEAGIAVPSEILDQPFGLVFGYDDAIAPAKVMQPFVKDIEALQILGGTMEGSFLTAKQVEALASLPSREQLLSKLVGTLQAPISGLVNVLHGNIRGLVTVLGQIRDAKTA